MWKPGGLGEGAEAGEERVGVHVGVGGGAAPGRLERDADAAAGERGDGVVGEGRAQEVATDSLELFAVAAVRGGRGVEIHAEGREGHRRRGCGLEAPPAGTPAGIAEQLAKDAKVFLGQSAVRESLNAQGLSESVMTPAAFAAYIRNETATWAGIIKARKIVAQ